MIWLLCSRVSMKLILRDRLFLKQINLVNVILKYGESNPSTVLSLVL